MDEGINQAFLNAVSGCKLQNTAAAQDTEAATELGTIIFLWRHVLFLLSTPA